MRLILLMLLSLFGLPSAMADRVAESNFDDSLIQVASAQPLSPTSVPTFEHHVMKKMGNRFAPTFSLHIDDCEGCYIAYDETILLTNGKLEYYPGIRGQYPTASFGRVKGGSVSHDIAGISPDVEKMCFHALKVCRAYDASTCTSLDSGLYYEWDATDGKVITTIPSKPEGLIKNEGQPAICAPLVS